MNIKELKEKIAKLESKIRERKEIDETLESFKSVPILPDGDHALTINLVTGLWVKCPISVAVDLVQEHRCKVNTECQDLATELNVEID